MSEHIVLDLPLDLRHASTVRAVAAALGADAGFSVDEIDDLRLGVNEAISVMCDVDGDPGEAARLAVRFDLADREVGVRVERRGVDEPVVEVDVLAGRILQAVVDRFGVDDAGVFTVVKRVAGDVLR